MPQYFTSAHEAPAPKQTICILVPSHWRPVANCWLVRQTTEAAWGVNRPIPKWCLPWESIGGKDNDFVHKPHSSPSLEEKVTSHFTNLILQDLGVRQVHGKFWVRRACQTFSGWIESHLELNSTVFFSFFIPSCYSILFTILGEFFHWSRSFQLEIISWFLSRQT